MVKRKGLGGYQDFTKKFKLFSKKMKKVLDKERNLLYTRFS